MPSSTSSGGDIASRFSHLLQPIRDLTKNWDVDVASHLEEYLAEVERIKISFDGGKTSMNFAEAALVIQGSACVYSKKVEYLYTLVYQTLDLIASKKRLQQASSVDDQGQDQDVSHRKDQEEEFLELDDIKEAKNIDLKEDEHMSTCIEIVPRTPIALIPLGQEDKQDVLLSRTGEVLGSRNDFKMNTCAIHASGALLLDLTHLPLVDNSFTRIPMSTPLFDPNQAGTTVEAPVGESLPEAMNSDFNTPELGEPALGDDYDDDDNNIAEGFEGPEHLEAENDGTEVEQEGRMALRRRDKMAEQQVERLPMRDPWKLLDPYNPGTSTQKPFKKGKPFRLPPSLKLANQAQKKRKRNTAIKVEPTQLTPIEEFITQAFYSHSSKLPKNPLKAPTFLEFEYLYWIEYRRRQEVQKRQKKLLSQMLAQEEIEELNTVIAENQNEEGVAQEQEVDTGFDAQGGEDSDDEDVFQRGHDNFDDADTDHCPLEPIALEEPSDNLVVSSYEDLVRHYVEGYLAEAQQYAQETDLSRRVRKWEEKILPTLQNEETHRLFDIHKYGEEVLGSFQGNSKRHFGEVVSGKEPYEICRYFLATLQLANNYNVEICTSGSGENAVDTMAITLLHKTPAHAAIASYRAPSVVT